MALDIVAWHDRTPADHQNQWNNARASGYSTLSVCVYGDPGSPLYAASMVKRATQTQELMFVGLSGATLQTEFNTLAAAGWGPEIITATGPANSAIFAAIFVPGPVPFTKYGITESDFISLNNSQMGTPNCILRWTDVYGDPGNLRYIGIWVPNADNRAWNCDSVDDDSATMQQRFNALVAGFGRPVTLAETPDSKFLMMYDDSQMPNWQAWDGMTSADYQTKFNTLYPQGLRPIRVSAKGSGSNARFSVLFSQQEDAGARAMSINGPTGSAAVPAVDAAMEAVMTANMLRGASIAVVSGTSLVYTRGYTFAEPGYPVIQPTTFFRQASVSKMFTAAAIYQLIDQGATLPGTSTALTLGTLLKDALPNIANGTPDPRWNNITIRHLLEMTSGVTSSVLGTDPSVSSTLPITALQTAQWLYRRMLGNNPGDTTQGNYSNAGYMLLGMIVARMHGASDYLTGLAPLLNSLSITRVRSSVSGPSAPGDEARYHSRPLTTEPSVLATGQPMCALGYGGWNLENCGGGGGISAAATDVARVLAALSVTFNNPMMGLGTLQTWLTNAANASATITGPFAHGFHGFDNVQGDGSTTHPFFGLKGGSLETSQNGVLSSQHGISVVMCWNGMTPSNPQWFSWNTNTMDPNHSVVMSAVIAQNWSEITDLFPTFGMPSFPVLKPIPIRPFAPRVFFMPSHMLSQKGPRKNM